MPMPEWLWLRRNPPASTPEEAALWTKCPHCNEMIYRKDLEANLFVCPRCGYHFRMHAFDRVSMIVDGDFVEIGAAIAPGDPLNWTDKRPYPDKLAADREKSKRCPIARRHRFVTGSLRPQGTKLQRRRDWKRRKILSPNLCIPAVNFSPCGGIRPLPV